MPRSSGGGSHGGGYHSSSSSHSSRSSYSSYSSSSGSSYSSGPSEKSFSRRPYSGASRYVYYDSRGRYHNIYHQGYTARADLGETSILCGVVSFIAVPIIVFLLWAGIFIPNKINTDKYDSRIVVENYVSEVSNGDTKRIYDSIKRFQDATGVTASVKIIYDSETAGYYDLEYYALSEYMRMFDDEYHWLVVVSIPDNPAGEFIDWSWESIIGEDLGSVIDYDSEDRFIETFHKHMLRSNLSTMCEEIASAYDEYTLHVMDANLHIGWITIAAVCAIIYLLIMYFAIVNYKNHKNMEKAVKVSQTAKEKECKYCGCAYIVGSISVCPHCGAAIPADSE